MLLQTIKSFYVSNPPVLSCWGNPAPKIQIYFSGDDLNVQNSVIKVVHKKDQKRNDYFSVLFSFMQQGTVRQYAEKTMTESIQQSMKRFADLHHSWQSVVRIPPNVLIPCSTEFKQDSVAKAEAYAVFLDVWKSFETNRQNDAVERATFYTDKHLKHGGVYVVSIYGCVFLIMDPIEFPPPAEREVSRELISTQLQQASKNAIKSMQFCRRPAAPFCADRVPFTIKKPTLQLSMSTLDGKLIPNTTRYNWRPMERVLLHVRGYHTKYIVLHVRYEDRHRFRTPFGPTENKQAWPFVGRPLVVVCNNFANRGLAAAETLLEMNKHQRLAFQLDAKKVTGAPPAENIHQLHACELNFVAEDQLKEITTFEAVFCPPPSLVSSKLLFDPCSKVVKSEVVETVELFVTEILSAQGDRGQESEHFVLQMYGF